MGNCLYNPSYHFGLVRVAYLTGLTSHDHLNLILHTRAFRQLIVSLGVRLSYMNSSAAEDLEVQFWLQVGRFVGCWAAEN